MKGHAAFGTLADLADGLLRGPAARETGEHAAACAECGASLAFLRAAAARIAEGAAADPPRSALRRALRVPLERRAAAAVEAVRTFVARLAFDSPGSAPAPAFALRGAAPRHLLFRAGPWELEVARAGEDVRGSLLPVEEAEGAGRSLEGTAVLLRGRRAAARAPVDARGRFVLRAVPAGRYDLRVEIPGEEILVPSLEL